MASTIESVDNVPKPPPQDKVNEAERSSSENQRRQFKKTLKESMQKGKDNQEDSRQSDTVIIEQDQKDQKQDNRRQLKPTEPDKDREEDEQDEAILTPEHIDLKA